MLKPRYEGPQSDYAVFVGRHKMYDIWADAKGIMCCYPSGEKSRVVAQHSWSRLRAGTFAHWPLSVRLRLHALQVMLESVDE